MWPWFWWLNIVPPPPKQPPPPPPKEDCQSAHKCVQTAAEEFSQAHEESLKSARDARHSARNVRMVMHALADRLERSNHAVQKRSS
jgi:hypothetical protein